MVLKISSAIAIAVFGFAQIASAQIQVFPQYDEIVPAWPSSLDSGYELPIARPYVPYPGQLGNPLTGTLPQPMFEAQPPLTLPNSQFIPEYSGNHSYSSPQLSLPQATGNAGNEIIINAEPIDGQILGVVQADGSIAPLPQVGSSTSLGNAITPSMMNESTPLSAGETFGELIVEAGDADIAAPSKGEASDEKANTPGRLQDASDDVAPSKSPEEVVDARNQHQECLSQLRIAEARLEKQDSQLAEAWEKLRQSETRVEQLDNELAESKAALKKQESQDDKAKDLSTEKKSIAAKMAKSLIEAESRVAEQDKAISKLKEKNRKLAEQISKQAGEIEKAVKAARSAKSAKTKNKNASAKKMAALEKDRAELQEDLLALKAQLKKDEQADLQKTESSPELSQLRRKLVNANRDMVKLRREIDESTSTIERLKKRNELRGKSDTKLKSKLSEAEASNKSLELAIAAIKKKLESENSERSKSADKSKKLKRLEKSVAESKKRNKSVVSQLKEVTSQLEETNLKLETQKKEYEARIAKMDKQYSGNAESHREVIKDLKDARTELALEKKKYAELKSKFIKAFEADKKKAGKKKDSEKLSDEEKRKAWAKKRDAEKQKSKEKAKAAEKEAKRKKSDAKKETAEASSKEKKRRQREELLREEMKKKMSEAENRIRTVGQKKIDSLIKGGKKKDSDEVKEAKEHIDESVKISNRKIRARYERKIKRLK